MPALPSCCKISNHRGSLRDGSVGSFGRKLDGKEKTAQEWSLPSRLLSTKKWLWGTATYSKFRQFPSPSKSSVQLFGSFFSWMHIFSDQHSKEILLAFSLLRPSHTYNRAETLHSQVLSQVKLEKVAAMGWGMRSTAYLRWLLRQLDDQRN
jgi:hypothetical protein